MSEELFFSSVFDGKLKKATTLVRMIYDRHIPMTRMETSRRLGCFGKAEKLFSKLMQHFYGS